MSRNLQDIERDQMQAFREHDSVRAKLLDREHMECVTRRDNLGVAHPNFVDWLTNKSASSR